MDRRDFFDPQELLKAAGQVIGTLDVAPSPQAVVEDVALLRFARRAMATQFEVLLPFGTSDALSLAETALDEINRLEDQLTVYHEYSDVSRINRLAFHEPVTVEERLFGLLALSARLSTETAGAFDVTSGPLIKAWGFFRRQGRVPPPEERHEVLQRVGMGHVQLDGERRTVRFDRPGVEINLGSIGKGYALDRIAELLRDRAGVSSALLHGGHSSVYALGTMPGDDRGWPVGIRHPWHPEQRLAVLRLRDRAVGTSAATFQHLEYNGKKLGHILDPRTGWPAEGMASATVAAPSAAEADALATAFFVLGVDHARAYCNAHPAIGALLMPTGENNPVIIGLGPHEVELIPSLASLPND
jgi:thiamine biosynthesis lipoprotein